MKIETALKRLGKMSRAEIIDYFEAEGIELGQDPDVFYTKQCPVAVYLKREAGIEVSVSNMGVWSERESLARSLPSSVADYIDWFDNQDRRPGVKT